MALTDLKIRSAKPAPSPYKLADSEGLYLLVTKGGGRLWRMDYRFGGKRKTIALGRYPATSLADARRSRDAARELLESGIDPSEQRKLDKLNVEISRGNTFRLIADEWLDKIGKEDRAEVTLRKSRWFVDLLAPAIGSRPIDAISAPELLSALRKIEARGKQIGRAHV